MKLKFVYSAIYDNLLTEMSKKKFSNSQIKEMEFYKTELEASWEKDGKKIMREIEKVSNLKFRNDKICFTVNHMKYIAISDPLTIKKESNLIRAKTILIHELIHDILEDNKENIVDLIKKTYPEESFEFKLHIPVLLITRKVIENVYGKNILQEVLEQEIKKTILSSAWAETNAIYPRFKGNILKFLKNEKLY